ncbi:MAG: hypothetical protein WCO69_01310 [Candidatus Omnitrophota bacterium]
MKQACVIFLCFQMLALPCTITPARAEGDTAFADTKTGKATTMFLSSMKQFFEDSKELEGKTDKEKVAYILDKGAVRILAKTADTAKEFYKTELTAYAEANLRSQLFSQIALPKINNDYLMKGKLTSIAWGDIDNDIKIAHAQKMQQFNLAMKGIEVSVNALVIFYNEGADKSIAALKESIGDELCGWLMPGWGYFRATQGAVQALGEYVIAYAFNTSLQAKIQSICPVDPKVDPKGFAQWLLGLKDIRGFVQKEWDEQLAYAGWYLKLDGNTDTKEEMGSAMKDAIIAQLEGLQKGLKDQQAKFDSVQDQINDKKQVYDDQARAAHDKFTQSVEKAMAKSKPYLDQLEAFRLELAGAERQDAEVNAAQMEALLAPVSAYVPLDRATILGALAKVYDLVSTDSRGYDPVKIDENYKEYAVIRGELINKCWATTEAGIGSGRPGVDRAALLKAFWVDVAALQAEEVLLFYKAQEKAAELYKKILPSVEAMQKDYQPKEEQFNKDKGMFMGEVNATLAFPDMYFQPGLFAINAERLGQQEERYFGAGAFVRAMEEIAASKEMIADDARKIGALIAKEKAMYQSIDAVAANIKNAFENAVPAGLRPDGWEGAGVLMVGIKAFVLPGPMIYPKAQYYATVDQVSLVAGLPAPKYEGPENGLKKLVIPGLTALRVPLDYTASILPKPDYTAALRGFDAAANKISAVADIEARGIQLAKMGERFAQAFAPSTPGYGDEVTPQSLAGKFAAPLSSSEGLKQMTQLKEMWVGSQVMATRINDGLSKIPPAYAGKVSSWDGVVSYRRTLKEIPLVIKSYETAYQRSLEVEKRSGEGVTMDQNEKDFKVIEAESGLSKQKSGLDELSRRLGAEVFEFEVSRRDALKAAIDRLMKVVNEKLEMAGGAGNVPVQDTMPLVQEAIGKIANAYEQKDSGTFSDYISDSYLGGKSALVEGARFDFDIFSSQRITLNINRIDTRKDGATVDAQWDKQAAVRASGQDFKTSGRITMVFILEGGRMKIKNLRGDLLFASLSPAIAQASGLGRTAVAGIERAHEQRDPGAVSAAAEPAAGNGGPVSSVETPQQPEPPAPVGAGLHTDQGIIPGIHMDFDFSSGAAGAAGSGDFTMLAGVLQGQGGAQIRNANMDFDSVVQAPASGYNDSILLSDGQTYCFKTKEGYYGKMRVQTAMIIPFIFEYVLQTNGSGQLK